MGQMGLCLQNYFFFPQKKTSDNCQSPASPERAQWWIHTAQYCPGSIPHHPYSWQKGKWDSSCYLSTPMLCHYATYRVNKLESKQEARKSLLCFSSSYRVEKYLYFQLSWKSNFMSNSFRTGDLKESLTKIFFFCSFILNFNKRT